MQDKEATNKQKRWKAPAVIVTCLMLLCAVTFGTNAMIVRADTQEAVSEKEVEWYRIKNDGTELVVFLAPTVKGYTWKYGTSNDKLRQLRYMDIDDSDLDEEQMEMWKVHLSARDGETGDVDLTFVCVKDIESPSVDTKKLKVHIEDGKMEVIE